MEIKREFYYITFNFVKNCAKKKKSFILVPDLAHKMQNYVFSMKEQGFSSQFVDKSAKKKYKRKIRVPFLYFFLCILDFFSNFAYTY